MKVETKFELGQDAYILRNSKYERATILGITITHNKEFGLRISYFCEYENNPNIKNTFQECFLIKCPLINKSQNAMKNIEEAAQEYALEVTEGFKGMVYGNIAYEAFRAGFFFSQRWIPVEEELPEVNIKVMAVTNNGKCVITSMYIPKDCKGNILGEREWRGSYSFKQSVSAWMPIPAYEK